MRKFIFGVGLHKTGTNSLNLALRELGFNSTHKLIFNDINSSKFDAFCHPPICSIYKQLQILHPGSKFILTTRNTESWLESFENHMKKFQFDKEVPLLKGQKHVTDMFKSELQVTYGTINVFADKAKLCEIKEEHEREVLKYGLKNFIVLPVETSSSEKWDLLCEFLEKPVPKTVFPHVKKRKQWTKV
jgi:hypothetical protein